MDSGLFKLIGHPIFLIIFNLFNIYFMFLKAIKWIVVGIWYLAGFRYLDFFRSLRSQDKLSTRFGHPVVKCGTAAPQSFTAEQFGLVDHTYQIVPVYLNVCISEPKNHQSDLCRNSKDLRRQNNSVWDRRLTVYCYQMPQN